MSDQSPPEEEPTPPPAVQLDAEAAEEAARHAALARLEAEVERRRAADPEAKVRRSGLERTQAGPELIERLRRLAPAAFTEDAEEPKYEDAQETIDRLTRTARREAWTNSLARANLKDERLAAMTLDRLDASQYPERLAGYVDHLRSPRPAVLNLVLAGRVGCGKTAAAVAVGNYAASKGLMVRVVKHSAYLAWLRPDGAGPDMPEWKVRDRFRAADLLILDDLGAEMDRAQEASRHVRDETLNLIADRIESGKGTVFTTNEPSAVLETMLGERVMSRVSDRGRVLVIEHADRRRNHNMRWG